MGMYASKPKPNFQLGAISFNAWEITLTYWLLSDRVEVVGGWFLVQIERCREFVLLITFFLEVMEHLLCQQPPHYDKQ